MGTMVTAASITAMAVPILRAFASQGIVRQSAETGVVAVRCCVSACGAMVSGPPPWIEKADCFSAPPAAAPAVWLKTCCSRHRVQVSTLAVKKKKKESLDFSLDNDIGGDDEVIGDMEEWINNKPAGFGNKVYDTALEEKLLAEIEHDKKSRLAAAMGLKENNGKANGKKSGKAGKAIRAAPPAGVEVWVGNLPRKKNVDRDLWAALRSVGGLLHVRPIVFAQNEKTREPLCKGYAFLTFKTDGDALDFVAKYHGTNITYGRVEKKLACEVAGSDSPWSPTKLTIQTAVTAATRVPKLHVRDNEAAISLALPSAGTTQNSALTAAKTSKNISEGSHKEGEKGDDEGKRILELELRVRQMERELKEKDAKLRQVAVVEHERFEMLEKRVLGKFKAIAAGTRAAKTKSEGASTGKKKGPKAVNRKTKSVKPMITLGSANRLKLKERKVLTDVMSKYAADPVEGVIS
ncbi:unnamed protein product [Sphagnum troendelagicum]|uniref:RRM domain-containing protein n=1 Tax=Sphagnum troendelagicum TaxID=128251 RepID=A0ABP0TS60_9BRYO